MAVLNRLMESRFLIITVIKHPHLLTSLCSLVTMKVLDHGWAYKFQQTCDDDNHKNMNIASMLSRHEIHKNM
jgi:hypothetical protein